MAGKTSHPGKVTPMMLSLRAAAALLLLLAAPAFAQTWPAKQVRIVGPSRGSALARRHQVGQCNAGVTGGSHGRPTRRRTERARLERHLAGGVPGPRALLGLPGRSQLQARDGAPVRGRDLELRLPGSGHPRQGRLSHQPCRHHAGDRGARGRRRDQLLREPLLASRRADRLRRRRQRRQPVQLRLPLLELRPFGQPARHRLRARHQRRGRHAQGFLPRGFRPAEAAHHDALRPGVRHAVARHAADRGVYRRRGAGPR